MPAEAADKKFDARVGAIEPAPHDASDHERHRERIEKDRPPDRFAAHPLVDGDGEREADRERQDDIEGAEVEKIAVGDLPARVRPEIEIGLQADKFVGRQHRAVGHRNVERPQREAEHIDDACDRSGRDRQPRSPGSQLFAEAGFGPDGLVRAQGVRHGHAFNRTSRTGRAAEALRDRSGLAYFCASTASAMALAASSGVVFGLLTKAVMVSSIAPRYFCRTVMLWAIERTSVPSAIEACKAFSDCC